MTLPPATRPTVVPAPAGAPVRAAADATGRVAHGPGQAIVHLAVNYRDAWLETRSYVDGGEFVRTCKAPCDVKLQVDGLEARVTAPGMTSSNTFRFAPGVGAAGVRVDGGSASLRRIGIITLAGGIPIALVGMALFGQGRLKDDDGLTAGGIAGLALGGVSIGISLPLLLLGTTHVKSAKGTLIARLIGPAASH